MVHTVVIAAISLVGFAASFLMGLGATVLLCVEIAHGLKRWLLAGYLLVLAVVGWIVCFKSVAYVAKIL